MKDLTLYDIMGEDHYILAKTINGEVNIMVYNEDEEVVFDETTHRFAWDSLVSFANMVINQNNKIQKEITSND